MRRPSITSADNTIEGLPQEHHDLLHACLHNLKPQTRAHLKAWIPDHALDQIRATSEAKAPEAIQSDLPALWQEALECVRGWRFDEIPAPLWENRAFVLAAVGQNGTALYHASKDLQADREVVLAAVRQDGLALLYASKDLRADRGVVLEAVKQSGWALEFASEDLRADREVVLAAVKQNGWALQFASKDLQADREFVLEAVRQDGWALWYASEDLRADREFVLEAVRQDGWALYHASAKLRADREVVLAAVRQDGRALQFASEDLRADREVVLAAVKQNGRALEYASKELRANPAFVLQCMKTSDELLFGISEMKGLGVWQPDPQTLLKLQVEALGRMIEKGDIDQFCKYARLFKSTWGDADTLFAGDPHKTLESIKGKRKKAIQKIGIAI